MLFRRLSPVVKTRSQLIRLSHVSDLAKPLKSSDHQLIVYKGQNLFFNITNHRLFAIKMVIFLAIPFAMPFIIVRYQLLKASGGGGGKGGPKTKK